MSNEFVPLHFSKILQSKAYTAIILGNETKHFAIYTEPQVGKNLQYLLSEKEHERPLSHALFFSILENLGAQLLQVVIYDVEKTLFAAHLFLEQKVGELTNILEVDARPSDGVTLALLTGSPILCRKEVLDKTIPFLD